LLVCDLLQEDEKRLASECELLGPLIGFPGPAKRGHCTVAKLARAIVAGSVRRTCELRAAEIQVRPPCSLLRHVLRSVPAGPAPYSMSHMTLGLSNLDFDMFRVRFPRVDLQPLPVQLLVTGHIDL